MRLDATDLRYVTDDEFRVLTAVEIGSKNHEVVPSGLIAEISGIRGGNVNKALGSLAKRGLVGRVQNARYDGFRLTYGGLDYLSLRTFSRRKPASVSAVGKKIGVGKESDIYIVKDESNDQRILKLHRLGRISFRAIKTKRDYLGKRSSASWMYMSRLGAQKEFAFMKALYTHGFPVPVPIDQSRHCIVMSLIDAYPLRQIHDVPSPSTLYSELMDLILRFAHSGLIHGDFNEFNILIRRKDGVPIVIDFPQMVSIRHENAEYFFNRDVNCIRKFFRKRFRYEGASWPTWKDVLAGVEEESPEIADDEEGARVEGETEESLETGKEGEQKVETADKGKGKSVSFEGADEEEAATDAARPIDPPKKAVRIDLEVEASGFGRELQRELEDYMLLVQDMPESDYEDDDDEDDDEEEEEEEENAEDQNNEPESKEDENFDEKAFQEKMAKRLESLRLNKALGNDDPDASDDPDALSSEEEEDSDDSSDYLSDGPPASDFTAYTRAPRVRPARTNVRDIGKEDVSGNGQGKGVDLRKSISERVMKEREAKIRGGANGVPKSGGLGKRKGQKWKSSAAHVIGKAGGGDGW